MLGDSHNFGRRVELRGERVVKPRTLVWEQLLLSARSPLRRALRQAARASALGPDAFEFLPTLKFWKADARAGGAVERVKLAPLVVRSSAERQQLAAVMGRAVALFSWLGLPDLHWENLALGSGAGGRLVFGPLDVEMVLSDFQLPTQTKLLPDADPEYAVICQHAAGVRRALPFLGKPLRAAELMTLLAQYRSTLELLDESGSLVAEAFASLPHLSESPIRVCLRGTSDYVHAATRAPWPPLLDAEAEQLARGDIPYFFRFYGDRDIRYYTSPDLSQSASLPSQRNVPKAERLLNVARGLRAPSRKKLREDGLFALVAAFDHPTLTGEHRTDGWSLSLTKQRLRLTLPSGDELETERDLSEFVSSVYLPCRCGEVKSVLVPPVTLCRPAKASV